MTYSMKQIAELLGVSYITVHRLLARGLLRSSAALRTKVIPKTETERFPKETTRSSVPEDPERCDTSKRKEQGHDSGIHDLANGHQLRRVQGACNHDAVRHTNPTPIHGSFDRLAEVYVGSARL